MNKLGHVFLGFICGIIVVLILMAKFNGSIRRDGLILQERNDSLLNVLKQEEERRKDIELKNANLRMKIEEVWNKEAQIINSYEKKINELESGTIDVFNARMDSVSKLITDYYGGK